MVKKAALNKRKGTFKLVICNINIIGIEKCKMNHFLDEDLCYHVQYHCARFLVTCLRNYHKKPGVIVQSRV